MSFELFEHTADIGVRGFGKTIEESFQECAKAMTSIMFDLNTIQAKESIKVKVSSYDLDSLLVEWLNEILAQMDIAGLVFSEFKINKIENNELEAELKGEKINLEKHHPKTQVKAATYSQMKVYQENGKWVSQCIVDV